MLRPVIYSHLRLQCKGKAVGRGSLPTPKKYYIHIAACSVILHSFYDIYIRSRALRASIRLSAEPGALPVTRTASFTLMLLKALHESLVLFHNRIVWVNTGGKTRISQCLYIPCNIVKRLNILVEEN